MFDFFVNIFGSVESYLVYVNVYYVELIECYCFDYFWNDIGYFSDVDVFGVLVSYYNVVLDGLMNDCWMIFEGMVNFEVSVWFEGIEGLILLEFLVWDVWIFEYGCIS